MSAIMGLSEVQPGDWFVVDPPERLFWWIELGESLIDGRKTPWGHAGICCGIIGQDDYIPPLEYAALPAGTVMIIEAEPHGAVEVPWHWGHADHLWSTGTGLSNPTMAVSALLLKGTPYSFLDYAAIEAHQLHLNVPGLEEYIKSTGHLICSQLVDVAAQEASRPVKLFDDGRWNGRVKPSDEGYLLEQHGGRRSVT